jgi:tetratricopeptide (TPR) repeat protein
MAKSTFSNKIDRLFRKNEWTEARKLLESEHARDPESHWILTQWGVTYYEQRRYKEALRLFLKAKAIVSDCPLTMWNLAGIYDALGKHRAAIGIYTWLMESVNSPDDDPCWESKEWTNALKTDCVYALGASYQQLGDQSLAEHCYRQYIDLLLVGIEGTYSIEEARRKIQSLHGIENGQNVETELKKLKAYLARNASTAKRRSLAKTKSAS